MGRIDEENLQSVWTRMKSYINGLFKNFESVINDTIQPLTDVLMDYVVESGTSEYWTYRKWNSGIAECWGVQSETISPYTTISSFNGYYIDIVFPSGLFNTVPVVTLAGSIGGGFFLGGTILNESADSCRAYTLSTADGSILSTWYINAKGRWK